MNQKIPSRRNRRFGDSSSFRKQDRKLRRRSIKEKNKTTDFLRKKKMKKLQNRINENKKAGLSQKQIDKINKKISKERRERGAERESVW